MPLASLCFFWHHETHCKFRSRELDQCRVSQVLLYSGRLGSSSRCQPSTPLQLRNDDGSFLMVPWTAIDRAKSAAARCLKAHGWRSTANSSECPMLNALRPGSICSWWPHRPSSCETDRAHRDHATVPGVEEQPHGWNPQPLHAGLHMATATSPVVITSY